MTAPLPCTLQQVSPHVWWYTPDGRTDRPSLALVTGERKTLMLDIGASIAHTRQFLADIQAKGLSAPAYAVITHWHWDHIFGMAALDIPIIASRPTSEQIRQMMTYDYSDAGLVPLVERGIEVEFTKQHMQLELSNDERRNLVLYLPDMTFKDGIHMDLGGVTCALRYVGGDHAADSTVIYVEQDQLLFLGDSLYPNIYELPRHYTREKVLPLINALSGYDFQHVIEGHTDQVLSGEQVRHWFDIIRKCYELIDRCGTEDTAALQSALTEYTHDEDASGFMDEILAGMKK